MSEIDELPPNCPDRVSGSENFYFKQGYLAAREKSRAEIAQQAAMLETAQWLAMQRGEELNAKDAEIASLRAALEEFTDSVRADTQRIKNGRDAEIASLRAALGIIEAQHSGEVCSTDRADCMAAIAGAALRAARATTREGEG